MMNIGILIIGIILIIGELVLGLILLFGQSYVKKKGEHVADKEDSRGIAYEKKKESNWLHKKISKKLLNLLKTSNQRLEIFHTKSKTNLSNSRKQ